MSKDYGPAAVGLVNALRQRHMAVGALILNVCRLPGMVEGFTPHARKPVRIPCGVSHHTGAPCGPERSVLPLGSLEVVVANDALLGGAKGMGSRILCTRCRHSHQEESYRKQQ